MDENAQNKWDPLDVAVTVQTFTQEQKYLVIEITNYRKRPYLLKLYLSIWLLLALITLAVVFISGISQLIVGFVPVFLYYGYIMKRQEKFILYLICEKNNWPYNPDQDYDRAKQFSSFMPHIFNQGHDQNVDEQIWGEISHNTGITPFWCAEFEYTVGSGRSQRTYTEYIHMFKLPKTLPTSFTLEHKSFFSVLEEQQIKTESEEFNKTFRIRELFSTDPASTQQIMKILSPSVITRLIDFSKTYYTRRITFQRDIMVVVLDSKIWKTNHTNFFFKVSIDDRDEAKMYESLRDMAQLPLEIVQFIE